MWIRISAMATAAAVINSAAVSGDARAIHGISRKIKPRSIRCPAWAAVYVPSFVLLVRLKWKAVRKNEKIEI